jgi:hypothetical protein
MNSVTWRPSGWRSNDQEPPPGTAARVARCARPVPATGSHSARAASASTSQAASAPRHPQPTAAGNGTVAAAPTAAPTLSDAE